MDNVRVPPLTTRVPALVAVTAAAVLGITACSNGGTDRAGSPSSSSTSASSPASPSASSTVKVPSGVSLTDQGSKLSFGTPATVIFEPVQNRGTVLRLTVQSVRQGTLADFKGFILDNAYKRNADYFYAQVRVENVGTGQVGGAPVPLWGVNRANTLLPAVNFTTRFPTCPSRALPPRFGAGAAISTCLVYLSPNKGGLRSVSYRPSQQYDPVTWTGTIAKPKPAKKG
jgi:hypothetical protein